MKKVSILGSTGSIGVQALELIAENQEEFQVDSLVAGGANLDLLFAQASKFNVKNVAIAAEVTFEIKDRFAAGGIAISGGLDAICEIASRPVDVVLNGITGSIGLKPSLAALASGNKLALANKESMVAGGELLLKYGVENIIPVDSEHNALYQALRVGQKKDVAKLILTASGGPFRTMSDLSSVTVAQALAHPTWQMGPVVSINSSNLFNKGLEIIEAHYLFDFPYTQISAVIHPQSTIHSLVEYVDGSTIAHASPPSMKLPIGYALNGANHLGDSGRKIDWRAPQKWEFEPIDTRKFPSIALAKVAGEMGQSACATINAANEVALSAFISEKISFLRIMEVVETVLTKAHSAGALGEISSYEDVSAVEENARRLAAEVISQEKGSSIR